MAIRTKYVLCEKHGLSEACGYKLQNVCAKCHEEKPECFGLMHTGDGEVCTDVKCHHAEECKKATIEEINEIDRLNNPEK